jgi:hypothetical protein
MKAWIAGIGHFLFGNNSKADTQQRPVVEPLEGRQFLSVSADPCAAEMCIMATAAATRTVSPQEVIHKYKGTIQTNLRPRPYKGMINVQRISPTGKVSGLISIPFLVQNYKFALHGTVRSDGTFTFSFKRPGVSGKLTGEYNTQEHLVGNFSGSGLGHSITGTFDFHKI